MTYLLIGYESERNLVISKNKTDHIAATGRLTFLLAEFTELDRLRCDQLSIIDYEVGSLRGIRARCKRIHES